MADNKKNDGSIILSERTEKNPWGFVAASVLVILIAIFSLQPGTNQSKEKDSLNVSSEYIIIEAGMKFRKNLYLRRGEEKRIKTDSLHFNQKGYGNISCFEFKMGDSPWMKSSESQQEFATEFSKFRRNSSCEHKEQHRLLVWNVKSKIKKTNGSN